MVRLLIVGIFLFYRIYCCHCVFPPAYEPPACSKDGDCMLDQVCKSFHCAFLCMNSVDCNPGEECQQPEEERKFGYCKRDEEEVTALKQRMGKVMGCMDFNTDLAGYTLPRGASYGVLTPEECSSRCENTKECQHWAWVGGKFKFPAAAMDAAVVNVAKDAGGKFKIPAAVVNAVKDAGSPPRYEPFSCMLKMHDGGRKAEKNVISGSKSCLSRT